jgi:hypothetical protein
VPQLGDGGDHPLGMMPRRAIESTLAFNFEHVPGLPVSKPSPSLAALNTPPRVVNQGGLAIAKRSIDRSKLPIPHPEFGGVLD